MKLRRLDSREPGFEAAFASLAWSRPDRDMSLEAGVRAILDDVRRRGDAALVEYTARLDRWAPSGFSALRVTKDELEAALVAIPAEQLRALHSAEERIRRFHERQRQESWEIVEADGTRLGQRVSALERVGIYVPGGLAAYPSSVLMNALPARVAGVREIVMASPAPGGERNPLVLAAAAVGGVSALYLVGGAQAVAAFAFGTESIPRVDKITGPGNAWVAEAKRQVFGAVGIDLIAGPSEIVVIADGTVPAEWVALDLFSQAEHDGDAQAILISPDANCLDQVETSMLALLPALERREIIERSLAGRGALIHARDLDEACRLANRLAPEHLELALAEPDAWLPHIEQAGAVFLGGYSSEALGDYCAGPNHVLPTAGAARFSSALGVADFQKRTSVIAVSRGGARRLGETARTLARGERLDAHARAAEARIGGPR